MDLPRVNVGAIFGESSLGETLLEIFPGKDGFRWCRSDVAYIYMAMNAPYLLGRCEPTASPMFGSEIYHFSTSGGGTTRYKRNRVVLCIKHPKSMFRLA
jgi:hypothetical protein